MSDTAAATDLQLLAQYARDHAEDAFAELVRRHVDLVYSAALRQVSSPELAEEVTQSAFTDLAQQSSRLARGSNASASLVGWLHLVTRRTAIDVIRRESRRQQREQIAIEMNAMNDAAASWTVIEPLLDEAVAALDDTDRAAVLLRHFENKSLREVGRQLGVSDDAAQKRVTRAVEKLREFLARRGLTIGVNGLIVVLSTNAVQSAPAGLALAVSTAATLASIVTTTVPTAIAAKTIAMTSLQKTLITATVVVLSGSGIYEAFQAAKLRGEVQALQQKQATDQARIQQLSRENNARRLALLANQPTLQLPAPPLSPGAAASTPDGPLTNLVMKLLRGEELLRLNAGQTGRFLEENRRSASSLLAAYRTSGDVALLEEAMQKFPGDPQVAFEAAFKKDISPADRRSWLDAFRQAAPDNALGDYLSALERFKLGQTDQAVQELITASGKSAFYDFTLERIQGDEEAYRSAGYAEVETSMAATWGLLLPQLAEFKQLGLNLVDLAAAYRKGGDEASTRAALDIALRLGGRLDGSSGKAGVPLVTQLVGIAIQQRALALLDPAGAYESGTVQERRDQLTQYRQSISDLVKQTAPLQEQMTSQDWINYNARTRVFGEESAIQWLLNKYGQK